LAGKEKIMIEKFFTQSKTLGRLHAGMLGPYLPGLATTLESSGYSITSIRRHLRAADHFGNWLEKHGIPVSEVSPATVERYIEGLGRSYYASAGPHGKLPYTALGLRGFVDLLREQGVAGRVIVEDDPLTIAQRWLTAFDHYLDHVVGCEAKTRSNYLCYARRLLHDLFAETEVDWAKLDAAAVTGFVRREAAKLKISACGQPVTAIRSLIRYLAFEGIVSEGMLGAVPSVLTWRHSSIPRAITADEVDRVIAACDSRSAYGMREKAIVVLLARLGLRAGEVIRLRIEDIDWVRGCVLVQAGKTHRERSLPLSQEVGDALEAYLRRARPISAHRELFLRWRPPFHPLRSSVSICALTQKLLNRAGISIHRPGAHVLRHSLATNMVIAGVSFKTVADVLGHQSLATTEIYAKLDVGSLSQVAMPWPGGAQ
jgi:site-specific recombinase XerD